MADSPNNNVFGSSNVKAKNKLKTKNIKKSIIFKKPDFEKANLSRSDFFLLKA